MSEESERLRHKIDKEMIDDIEEYIELHHHHSLLDGWFTASELRRIADAMDRLAIEWSEKFGGDTRQ
jgi:hypothetical protein